jgi:cytidine deaminase
MNPEDKKIPLDKHKTLFLIEEARKAREFAYAPYSRFLVGAALMTTNGQIFRGCNVEISNFSATICAERTALVKAVSEGFQSFMAIAVIADRPMPTSPCGQCRQALSQFGLEMEVIMATTQSEEIEVMKLSELLPRSFLMKLPCQE